MEQHYRNSSSREKLLEHLFIGELLKLAWQKSCSLEISRPEVDNAGYDLIAEANGIIRHIQLKTSFIGSSVRTQKVHIALADKPSGCVIWIYFDKDTLELGPFLFFGGQPGEKLPDMSEFRNAKHTKGNAQGVKQERPSIKNIGTREFTIYKDVNMLFVILFADQT